LYETTIAFGAFFSTIQGIGTVRTDINSTRTTIIDGCHRTTEKEVVRKKEGYKTTLTDTNSDGGNVLDTGKEKGSECRRKRQSHNSRTRTMDMT
jgi:hypothetical protein